VANARRKPGAVDEVNAPTMAALGVAILNPAGLAGMGW